jgi:hypothetical protein
MQNSKREHKYTSRDRPGEAYLEDEHAEYVVTRSPDTVGMHRSMNRSEKGAIEPPTALRDEFRNLQTNDEENIKEAICVRIHTVVGTSVAAFALFT